MKTPPAVLLLDGNNLLAASTHANLSLTTKKGTPTGGVFGVLRQLRSVLLEEFSDVKFGNIWFVRDAGRPAFRTTLCPEYKSNRGKNDSNPHNRAKGRDGSVIEFAEAYRRQKPLIEKFLPLVNVGVSWFDGWEADDVIALLATGVYVDRPVYIMSGDKDMLQLVEKGRVHVYMPHKGKMFTKVPRGYLLRRCLEGDPSDNIPGVTGLGSQRAVEIIEESKASTPKQLLKNYRGRWWPAVKRKEGQEPSAQMRLSEDRAQERLRRNWRVMNLRVSVRKMLHAGVRPDRIPQIAPAFKPKAFHRMCRKYAFNSIIDDGDSFLRPFREVSDD